MKIITLLFVLTGLTVQGQDFAAGDGSAGDPYQVETVEHLNNVRNHLDKHFIQTAHIDLTDQEWEPIGSDTDNNRFTGSYDGGVYHITGLYISLSSTSEVGLFGCIGKGTSESHVSIKNVELINVRGVSGLRATGSLVGRVRGNIYTIIENCSATGSSGAVVSGTGATGGLVGANNSHQETPGGEDNPVISGCFADISVEARDEGVGDKFGGLVGCNQKGTTINSYARGSVEVVGSNSFVRVGGLAGCVELRGRIITSYSSGTVTPNGADKAGGLVGHLGDGAAPNRGTVNDSYYHEDAYTSSAAGTPLSEEQMKQQASFSGFDFVDVWNINDGTTYPTLKKVPVTTYISWTGAVDDCWENLENWDPKRAIESKDILVIPDGKSKYPVITDAQDITIQSKSLNINLGAAITIAPKGKLTINGSLNNAHGNISGIVIESNAANTGSLIHQTNDVEVTIQRYITGEPIPEVDGAKMYHTVSVPVTQSTDPMSELFLGSYLYSFNVTNQAWELMGSATDNHLEVDRGYMIYYPDDNNTTYTFAGQLNNGVFEYPVEFHEAGGYSGFNLVPNPYPSAIDWESAEGWTKENINNSVWIWDPQAGQYAAYAGGEKTNNGTSIIPVGQSFFVQANDTGTPSLSVNNSARVHSDQAFFKEDSGQPDAVLRIRSLTGNYRDEAVIRLKEGATAGSDPHLDAEKMFGIPAAPQIYSHASDGRRMSIYSHPHPEGNITIPLSFELEKGSPVKFEFEGAGSFREGTQLLLEDLFKQNTFELEEGGEYEFTHIEGADPERFALHIKSQQVTSASAPEEKIQVEIFSSDLGVHVSIPSMEAREAEAELFDLMGRSLGYMHIFSGSESILSLPSYRGVVIVRVTAGSEVFTRRLIIK